MFRAAFILSIIGVLSSCVSKAVASDVENTVKVAKDAANSIKEAATTKLQEHYRQITEANPGLKGTINFVLIPLGILVGLFIALAPPRFFDAALNATIFIAGAFLGYLLCDLFPFELEFLNTVYGVLVISVICGAALLFLVTRAAKLAFFILGAVGGFFLAAIILKLGLGPMLASIHIYLPAIFQYGIALTIGCLAPSFFKKVFLIARPVLGFSLCAYILGPLGRINFHQDMISVYGSAKPFILTPDRIVFYSCYILLIIGSIIHHLSNMSGENGDAFAGRHYSHSNRFEEEMLNKPPRAYKKRRGPTLPHAPGVYA